MYWTKYTLCIGLVALNQSELLRSSWAFFHLRYHLYCCRPQSPPATSAFPSKQNGGGDSKDVELLHRAWPLATDWYIHILVTASCYHHMCDSQYYFILFQWPCWPPRPFFSSSSFAAVLALWEGAELDPNYDLCARVFVLWEDRQLDSVSDHGSCNHYDNDQSDYITS